MALHPDFPLSPYETLLPDDVRIVRPTGNIFLTNIHLGRGLRRMYFGSDQRETVSVMGTPAFMEFVESIQSEGVNFERVPMGGVAGREREDLLIVEVDKETPGKDIDALDIALPRLTRRFNREFKDLSELDPASFGNGKLPLKPFTAEETREIVFKTMLDAKVDHRKWRACAIGARTPLPPASWRAAQLTALSTSIRRALNSTGRKASPHSRPALPNTRRLRHESAER